MTEMDPEHDPCSPSPVVLGIQGKSNSENPLN